MKSPQPLISVIIPVFNRAWQLKRALESLQAQTFKDFEVIVCDDGSTEDINGAVKGFDGVLDIHYLHMPNWGGPAKPRNEGLKIARGEWISYLDSDDWWDKNRLAMVVERLNDSIDVLYHPLRVVKESTSAKSREKRLSIGDSISNDPFEQMILLGNPLPTSATLVRKDLLTAHQGMSEERRLIALEDFDCWLRLASGGARFYFLNQCMGNYWIGQDAISAVSERSIEGQKLLFERHHPFLDSRYQAQAQARQNFILGMLYMRLGSQFEKALEHMSLAHPLPTLQMTFKRLLVINWLKFKLNRFLGANFKK